MRSAERAQDRPQHLLGRGLADAAGDRDQAAAEPGARIAAEPVQRRQRVVHQQQPGGVRHDPMHHRAGRALGQRVGDEVVTVAGFTAQRDEQIARLQRARVDRDAGGGERRRHRSAGRLEQVVGGPQRGHATQLTPSCRPPSPPPRAEREMRRCADGHVGAG